eukprot:1034389-Prorocentrum_minimum.AAC.1
MGSGGGQSLTMYRLCWDIWAGCGLRRAAWEWTRKGQAMGAFTVRPRRGTWSRGISRGPGWPGPP